MSRQGQVARVQLSCTDGVVSHVSYYISGIKKLLKDNERSGVYTTMLVSPGCGSQVVDLNGHVERLERSLRAYYDGYTVYLDGLRDYVALWVERGLECVAKELGVECWKMVILVMPVVESECDNREISLDDVLEKECGGVLRMYVSAYPYVECSPKGPAYILGPPREHAQVKDIAWISEREYLEKLAPSDAVDVLLVTSSGKLMEGLLTNVFVVLERMCHGVTKAIIQTAPVEAGVLWGTMRSKVIDVCRDLGLEVDESCPCFDERHLWKEAFITNRYVFQVYEYIYHK
jgi:hypothetical protein